MQTIVSFIDRKTNLQVCSAIINLSNIKESDLSPSGILDYIWKDVLANGMLGDRKDYLIHLFNKRNHTITLHEIYGKMRIKETAKISGNKGSVICFQDYKNNKLRKYAG
ncbi:hypothetical protein [Nitrosomonas supralitoralis]|uniref:Uncharacterized protein n=1 Tax=Nitrosomonas supralitoralis TaxID=2116706 RepID=A0A2P7NRF8_9PROT|nr:hypothetical protein [Nitrosomonas supralitoralis]PSJ16053.1 hypothetical protein C7H79_15660 [Nitrosomonas supralitoralis]